MTAFALAGARIFDGVRLRDGYAVVIDGERIRALVPEADVPDGHRGSPRSRTARTGLHRYAGERRRRGAFQRRSLAWRRSPRSAPPIAAIGTTGFLPTFITDSREHMAEAVAAARPRMAAGVPGVLGIHLEGPFLNPERKGVHQPRFMRPIDEADVAIVTALRAGPDDDDPGPEKAGIDNVARLAKAGVILSAGHTAATYETVMAARAAGLTGFTHLFNAMPPLAGREPGPVGAALDDPDAWAGIIVDLHHVSVPSLRVAIAARGYQRMMLVTDAMPLDRLRRRPLRPSRPHRLSRRRQADPRGRHARRLRSRHGERREEHGHASRPARSRPRSTWPPARPPSSSASAANSAGSRPATAPAWSFSTTIST